MSLDPERIGKTLDDIDAIGNRYHGSPGERTCRDYIAAQFEALGLEDVRLEPFRYLAYEHGSAAASVTRPAARPLTCKAVQYSAVAEAEGEAVYVGTGTAEDFERVDRLGVDLAGKVVVAHSIAPFMIAPFLADRGIAAFVNLGDTPDGIVGNFTAALYRPPLAPPWEGRPVAYPAVNVEAAEGRALLSEMTLGTVRVRVQHSARYVEKDAHNVVALLRGSDPRAGEVVVGGHYDSQAEGPCVWDNGTGIASIIEIARVLAQEPLARDVRVVAFAVEEVGLWGSTAYTVQHADEMDAIAGMVNLDAVASAFPAKHSIWTDEAMEPFAVAAAEAQGWDVEEIADARAFEFSDNNPFTDAGVPACWIWEFPPIHPYYHSSGDTRARVEPAKVAATAAVSAQIARRLALDPGIDLGRARRRGEVPVAGGAA